VVAGLGSRWSPAEVAAILRVDRPDDEGMRVSAETIYCERTCSACAHSAPHQRLAGVRITTSAGTSAAGLRYGVYLPPMGPLGDPRALVDLARRAEAAGWDGVFLWDHVLTDMPPIVDTGRRWARSLR